MIKQLRILPNLALPVWNVWSKYLVYEFVISEGHLWETRLKKIKNWSWESWGSHGRGSEDTLGFPDFLQFTSTPIYVWEREGKLTKSPTWYSVKLTPNISTITYQIPLLFEGMYECLEGTDRLTYKTVKGNVVWIRILLIHKLFFVNVSVYVSSEVIMKL